MADPGSPQWWLQELSMQLTLRAQSVREYRRYYDGDHRLIFASDKFLDAFGDRFSGRFADNWCSLVVDAVEERLDVVGFRFGDSPDADKDAWEIWQRNSLDVESQLAHLESITCGSAGIMVWPDIDGQPEITIEAADQVIVARSTANRRVRLAALKSWVDEYGAERANLYLPDALYKFERKAAAVPVESWGPMMGAIEPPPTLPWTDPEIIPNPFGVVPVVELDNRPRLLGPGRSEIASVIPLNNAVNKLLADLMVTSEYSAAPQRYVLGVDIEEDEAGRPKAPWRARLDEIVQISEGTNEGVAVGSFPAADLGNYVKSIEMVVQHIASQSRTPPHYFYLSGQFPSGESIKAAETSLIAKALRKQRVFGEEWEEVMRLAFQLIADKRANEVRAETLWRDAESRTESQHIDAVLKQQALNVPNQKLWEKAGYSPLEIEQMIAMGSDPGPEALTTQPKPIHPGPFPDEKVPVPVPSQPLA